MILLHLVSSEVYVTNSLLTFKIGSNELLPEINRRNSKASEMNAYKRAQFYVDF